MVTKRSPSIRQYQVMLKDHHFTWEMDYEMKNGDAPPVSIRRKHEQREDILIEYSQLSEMHSELYNAHFNHATVKDSPKPKLVEAARENGKIVYKIIHDTGDGLIFDWRKQHV